MRPDQLERPLHERLDALGPALRAQLLHVLMLPDFERADRIGEFWGNPKTRTFAELLIDCGEDRTLLAVLVGMLREGPTRVRAQAAGDERGITRFSESFHIPSRPQSSHSRVGPARSTTCRRPEQNSHGNRW
jgi:hypothetical protein